MSPSSFTAPLPHHPHFSRFRSVKSQPTILSSDMAPRCKNANRFKAAGTGRHIIR